MIGRHQGCAGLQGIVSPFQEQLDEPVVSFVGGNGEGCIARRRHGGSIDIRSFVYQHFAHFHVTTGGSFHQRRQTRLERTNIHCYRYNCILLHKGFSYQLVISFNINSIIYIFQKPPPKCRISRKAVFPKNNTK